MYNALAFPQSLLNPKYEQNRIYFIKVVFLPAENNLLLSNYFQICYFQDFLENTFFSYK